MKQFLETHILFPKRFGALPYFWLIFLIPTIAQLVPLVHPAKWVLVLLMLIFLKAYRDGYEITRHLDINVFVQIAISVIFGIFLGNGTLFVFTAWEIGSLTIPKKIYQRFLLIYYIAAIVSIGSWAFYYRSFIDLSTVYNLSIAFLFALVSPIIARSLNMSTQKRYRLIQKNQRLESIIRQGERERIARDLHDNLGQTFSIITMKTELAAKLLEKNPELVAQELQEIAATSRSNLTVVRKIVSNLQERTIAKTMIEEEKNLQVADILLLGDNEELAENWPLAVQDIFSAVIKEASTNMIRHSQATYAEISFYENPENFCVTVHDNGIGFKKIREGANGIEGMKKRIEAENGSFVIESLHGTTIQISLPKQTASAELIMEE